MNIAEHLKNQLDIVEVIQHYMALKRQGSGQRWKGLCPFHSEKTPSFNVDGSRQYYKCFGCEAGGDALGFVQQMESLTFPETLEVLAERYGIPLPKRQRGDDPETQRRAALFDIHEAAAEIFQDNLRSPAGERAREYLASRGVSADAAREFRLGLSDSSGQQITQRLKRFGEGYLLESGLVKKRQEGAGLYDHFRGRLMFPIHDASGKVIAFGGRALHPDEKVKYVNSPETKLYVKSSVLYNMHRAKIAARKSDRMILVEGYMDAIGISSSGIEEVVALCGTALGTLQIRAMKQQISYQAGKGHVVLNFDSDAAGARSTEKYIATLLTEGLRVKVLEIPGGLDPDEYIQQKGADAYRKLVETAPSYFHWLTDHARSRFDMRTAEGRIDAFKLILPSIERVQDRIERAAIATEVAEHLGVEREMIRQALKEGSHAHTGGRKPSLSSAVPPGEKLLLACLLVSPDARAVVRHYLAGSEILSHLELRIIFEAILACDSEAFSFTTVIAGLEQRFQSLLAEMNFSECDVREDHAADQALDCLRSFEVKSIQTRGEALKRQIRELETQGNLEGAMRLMNELEELKRRSATG